MRGIEVMKVSPAPPEGQNPFSEVDGPAKTECGFRLEYGGSLSLGFSCGTFQCARVVVSAPGGHRVSNRSDACRVISGLPA